MNKVNIFFIFMILISVLIPPSMAKNILTEEITIKSIAPSPYYDSKPSVWGNNIVWRRAVNQNNNAKIELSEPSWIMVYNIESGKSYNITPMLTFVYGDKYNHAEAPDIYGNKIIYEAQVSGNSSDTRLFMYDIDTKITTLIPLITSTNCHGHLHLIYDKWIVYTDIQNHKRQAYLYNYESGAYRTIVSKIDSHTVYGMEMDENGIVLTVTSNLGTYEIWYYNLGTLNTERIIIENITTMATSINNNIIGITQKYNQTSWAVYEYNILTKNLTLVERNAFGIITNGNEQVYQFNNSIIFRTNNNVSSTILSTSYLQYLGDKQGNTLVWMENSNSNVSFGDARDDFDIYVRTVITVEQMVIDGIWFVISIIGVILIIVAAGIRYRYNIYGD